MWFAEHGERELDVTEFSIVEPMSSLFEVVVTASSQDGTLSPSSFVGKGAAFRFAHHAGDLVWAGICSEAAQISNQPHGATTLSVYRFVIVPALWRTTLRRNNRTFQQMTVPEILSKVLDEWEIPHAKDLLKEPHLKHEYRVQYGETDFAFLSRLCEEEGISYFFDHAIKTGAGSKVTSILFADKPETRDPIEVTLPYRNTGKHKTFADGGNVIYDVTLGQEMRFGTATIGDFDLRLLPHMELLQKAPGEGAAPEELVYEDYQYLPGAFRALPGTGDPTPIADDKGLVRTVQEQREYRTKREIGAARSGRTTITLKTTALELTSGDVFAIGQNSTEVHPNTKLSKDRKLVAIGRRFTGDTQGIKYQTVEAVPADVPHRPPRKTAKPRIAGVQSAIVSGPKSQEIHTDELGRVRVQFRWDREHGYDDKSSCWMRVSQGWAGSGFGVITLPRVGQEVLVGFYEGDPDRPVVVGRVYNLTNGVPYTLAGNKTKSGWRSESSGGDGRSRSQRGYNELMFEDAVGKEQVALRAEASLSTLVKAAESRDVGGSRATRIKAVDSTHVGKVSLTRVGEHTDLMLTESGTPEVFLSTGGATLRLAGKNLLLEARGEIHLHGGTKVEISTRSEAVWVKGAKVDIDCGGKQGDVPNPPQIGPAVAPSSGPLMHAPYEPEGTFTELPPPRGFQEVEIKNAKEQAEAAAAQAPTRAAASAADDQRAALPGVGSATGGTNTIGAASNPASLGPRLPSVASLAPALSAAASVASLVPGLSSVASLAPALSAAASVAGLAPNLASVVPGLSALAPAAGMLQKAAAIAAPLGITMNPVLSQGLALAAGKSPLALVQSLGMAELQKAFVKTELAMLPLQQVSKLNAVAQQVVGYVDLKDKAMVLLKGWG